MRNIDGTMLDVPDMPPIAGCVGRIALFCLSAPNDKTGHLTARGRRTVPVLFLDFCGTSQSSGGYKSVHPTTRVHSKIAQWSRRWHAR